MRTITYYERIEIGNTLFDISANTKIMSLSETIDLVKKLHKNEEGIKTDADLAFFIMKTYKIKEPVWQLLAKRPSELALRMKITKEEAEIVGIKYKNIKEEKKEEEIKIATETFARHKAGENDIAKALMEVQKIYSARFEKKEDLIFFIMKTHKEKENVWNLLIRRPDIFAKKMNVSQETANKAMEMYNNFKEEEMRNTMKQQGVELIDVKCETQKEPEKTGELNLFELLENCKGQVFYMPHYGKATLGSTLEINDKGKCMMFHTKENGMTYNWPVDNNGKSVYGEDSKEICVFPSKEQRDWSLFQPPFIPKKGERVWVRNGSSYWLGMYFVEMTDKGKFVCVQEKVITLKTPISQTFIECIPFDKTPW